MLDGVIPSLSNGVLPPGSTVNPEELWKLFCIMRKTMIPSTYRTLYDLLTWHSSLSTSNHTTFLSRTLTLGYNGYSIGIVIKSKYWRKISVEQEMRLAISNLISKFEEFNSAQQIHNHIGKKKKKWLRMKKYVFSFNVCALSFQTATKFVRT